MKEVWKDIDGSDGLYQCSNLGRVKRLRKYNIDARSPKYNEEHFIKGLKYNNGYVFVWIGSKRTSVHRLVAKTFIPNPLNKPQVNHKDGDKQNNRVDNLEWNTAKENIVHAVKNKLKITKKGGESPSSKSVYQIDINTNEIIKKWDCIIEVERQLGIRNGSICKCCMGKYKTAGGYKWKYCEDCRNNE